MRDIEAQKLSQNRYQVLALCGVTAVAIFISDLLLPLGIAEAVPYVAVVLISLRSPHKQDPFLVAVGCSILTMLGYVFSGEGAETWMAVVNRGIAIFAIWVTAILAMQIKEADITARTQSQMLMGILGNTPTVAFTVDQDGYLRESQGKGLHRIGLTEKSSVGRNPLEPPAEIKAQADKLESGEALFYESRGTHHGAPWWFLNYVTPNTIEGEGAIGFGIDITEQKLAERRMATHDAVTQVLAESTTLSEATPKILQAICEQLDWQIGVIWKVDYQGLVLYCVEDWYEPSSGVKEFAVKSNETTFAPGIGLPGRVWESGNPAWIEDVTRDPNFPRAPFASKANLHAAFGFPISLGDQVFGVMEFFSQEIQEPDEALLQMFSTIGSQIGQFIERENQDRRLQAQYHVTTILAESTSLAQASPHILEAICGSLGWAFGAIWHVDSQQEVLRCVEVWKPPSAPLEEFLAHSQGATRSRGIGLPGRVWEGGEPAWIADVVLDPNFPRASVAAKEGLHAAFCFPIKIGSNILGVMEFFNRETQEPDKELMEMFGAIGIQIGHFIQRMGMT
jgi:GAF domain-containing protein